MSISTNIYRPFVCDPLHLYISLVNNSVDPITHLFGCGTGLLTHLGHLIFTLYIRTYVLSFVCTVLWFLALIINMVSKFITTLIIAIFITHLQSSFLVRHLLPLQCTLFSIIFKLLCCRSCGHRPSLCFTPSSAPSATANHLLLHSRLHAW